MKKPAALPDLDHPKLDADSIRRQCNGSIHGLTDFARCHSLPRLSHLTRGFANKIYPSGVSCQQFFYA